ncbi:MAG: DUF4339 domain-containing protein [Planctomycetaceae bacterium]|nr:DUF4339 domain-containing protein [Planctomycetaceae bacterium]
MINEWYYQRDGEEIGPVPFEQIKDLAQRGQLSPDDQIRDAVSGMLLPAKSIGGLFPPQAGQQAGASMRHASRRRSRSQNSPSSVEGKPNRSHQRNLYEESGIGQIAEQAAAEQDTRRIERARRNKAAAVQPSSGSGRFESPNANTRRAASRISEYAENIKDDDSGGSRWAALGELKEHPIKLTILSICVAAAIFKYLPERNLGPSVYREFNQIYAEMDQQLTAGVDEEQWNTLKEQSQSEIEVQIDKLTMKETRTPAERQLITVGKKLYNFFDVPEEFREVRKNDLVKSLNSVREELE